MMAAENAYIAVNVVLGIMCLIAIFIVPKSIPVKRLRIMLIIALVAMILAGGALTVAQKFFRLYALAFTGDTAGVTEGAVEMVEKFIILSPIGSLLELAAVVLLVLVGKGLISHALSAQPEGGGEK